MKVPPEDMDEVRSMGARQDRDTKWFFISDRPDSIELFRKWVPKATLEKIRAQQIAERQAQEEAEASRSKIESDWAWNAEEKKRQEKVRLKDFFITEKEAIKKGLTIGISMYGCPNSGTELPRFHPGDPAQGIPPHIHDLQDNGSNRRRGYTSLKCSICGAQYVCDSSD